MVALKVLAVEADNARHSCVVASNMRENFLKLVEINTLERNNFLDTFPQESSGVSSCVHSELWRRVLVEPYVVSVGCVIECDFEPVCAALIFRERHSESVSAVGCANVLNASNFDKFMTAKLFKDNSGSFAVH